MLTASDLSVNNLLNPIQVAQFDGVTVSACVLDRNRSLPAWLEGLKPDDVIAADCLFTNTSSDHKYARLARIRGLYGVHAACLHVSVQKVKYLGRTMMLSSRQCGWEHPDPPTLKSIAAALPKPTLLATSDPGVFLLFDTKLYLD